MYRKYTGGFLLLFLLVFTFTAGAQTVPLGDAAKFALLAGGDIRANTAVQAMDYAGAGQSVDTMVTAGSTYLRGETDQALSHLAEAMAYCNNREAKELNREIVDIELEESVYKASGPAVLGGRLVLHGNAGSVFIFNIAGDLDVKERTQLILGDVRPENVFWNVAGRVTIDKNTTFTGIVMAADGIDFLVPSGLELALLTQGTVTFTAAGTEATSYESSFYSHDVLGSRIIHHCAAPVSLGIGYNFGSVQGNVPLFATNFSSFGTDAAGQPYTEATLEIELTSANNPVYTVEKKIDVLGPNQNVDVTAEFKNKYGFAIPCGSFLFRARYYNACSIVHSIFSGNGIKINVNCFSVSLPDASACTNTPVSVTATIIKHPDLYGPNVYLNNNVPAPIKWYLDNIPLPAQTGNGMTATVPANLLTQPGQYTLKTEMSLYLGGTNSHTETQTSVITVAAPVQVNVSTAPSQLCAPGSITATILNGVAGHIYNVQVTYGATPAAPFQVTGLSGATLVPLPALWGGAYTLTVYDAAAPGCLTTVSFTVGGTKTLGAPGVLTTIDASQALNNTVNFSGEYYVAGPLKFIKGTFNMQPGTTFYFEPYAGITPSAAGAHDFFYNPENCSGPQTFLLLDDYTTLNVNGTTLTVAACGNAVCNGLPLTGIWGGINVRNNSVIRTASAPDPANPGQTLLSEISFAQAAIGLGSTQGAGLTTNTNDYFLSGTRFLYNVYGILEYNNTQALTPGEGVTGCRFETNNIGFAASTNPYPLSTDYSGGAFSGNTFTGNDIGFMAEVNGLALNGNTFTGNDASVVLLSHPAAGPVSTVTGNIITVPAGGTGLEAGGKIVVTANTITGPGGSANGQDIGVGVWSHGLELTNNTIQNFATGLYMAAYMPTGLVTGNTIRNNATGFEINSGWYNHDLEISANTFTDNETGIAFTRSNNGVTPPLVQCNKFSAPNLPNSKGIYLAPGVRMAKTGYPNELGGDGLNTQNPIFPNGNRFISITNPVFNDNPITPLNYWVYNQPSQDIAPNPVAVNGVIFENSFQPAANACTGLGYTNGNGVNARQGSGTTVAESEAGLGQAYPNPAQNQVTIPYALLPDTKAAALVLREVMTGHIVKTYELTVLQIGSQQIGLQALRSGLYTYTLLIDGKPESTKILRVEK